MHENFYQLSGIVEAVTLAEKPDSVLEISGNSFKYGRLLYDCIRRNRQEFNSSKEARIDRIDLTGQLENCDNTVYNKVYAYDVLNAVEQLPRYDSIVIFDLFENLHADNAKAILEALLHKVNISILVITPEYPYDIDSGNGISAVRSYHPVFFQGLDFSYCRFNTADENWQVYTFFPSAEYAPLPIDELPTITNRKEKLRIAYILPHHKLTGGIKALLQQMKEMTSKGHIIKAFYRGEGSRAIPEWSHLQDNDVSEQIVVPPESSFLDYIKDVDIVIVGWMQQLDEFVNCNIPVVLWEQGSEYIYGDYGKIQLKMSQQRLSIHHYYRLHVYLLAVSTTLQKILKDVYNREAQLFPNGIDTDFYFPSENKNKEIPVIMLVGNPSLQFKGFSFALEVLEELYELGDKFEVWWASQVDFSIEKECPFTIKKFIELPQDKLALLYRNADIFLSTPLYESFPLPPIEAMASGTAVVSTENGGIRTYAVPGENCLLADQGDKDSLAMALSFLLRNPEARKKLASAGRETALKYTFKEVVLTLEDCLYKILESSENQKSGGRDLNAE